MANSYETGVGNFSPQMTPRGATKPQVSFWEKQSAKIAGEKKSQQQLRNQLIEQKLQMNKSVLGKMKPTEKTFDNNTNIALTGLVDKYVDIKNGMMKSEGEDGYVETQLGMRALRQIEDQASDVAFFNNQLSSDILPHLRKMIGKDASLGYKDSKGAMSTAVPTGSQRLMMAIDNNENVNWEFNDDGELILVMPAGEKDGVEYEKEEFNLNQYGKYIEKGEEFFFEIPDIDQELNGAAEAIIGTPGEPKLGSGKSNGKSYYTYDKTSDGNVNYNTVQITDKNRERAVSDLMKANQFQHLLYNEDRLNDRKALWQDCVGSTNPDLMAEDYRPGTDLDLKGVTTGQHVAWDGSEEQLEILHKWLAETAIDQNLAHGVHVTGVSRRSSGSGTSQTTTLTSAQRKKMEQYEDVFRKNYKLALDVMPQDGKPAKLSRESLIKRLNESIGIGSFDKFILGKDLDAEMAEGDIHLTTEDGEEVEEKPEGRPLDIYYIRADGEIKKIGYPETAQEIMDLLNKVLINNDEIIYNLNTHTQSTGELD